MADCVNLEKQKRESTKLYRLLNDGYNKIDIQAANTVAGDKKWLGF